jgi:hypothetical protein
MVTVPADTPVITPLVLPIVAFVTSLLAHVPPTVAHVSVVEPGTVTAAIPYMRAGSGFTVILRHMRQVVGNEYVIRSGDAATPVTTPVVGTTVA